MHFFTFLPQEVREYLAEIGVERLDDIIGRTDLIVRKPDEGIRKHQLISFDKLLARVDNEAAIRHVTDQQHGSDHVKDVEILHAAAQAVESRKEVSLEYTIANTDRACGAMLSGVIAAKYGEKGLPEHTLNVKFKGSAGQSFGAFIPKGLTLKLTGDSNDYFGIGLSGGKLIVKVPEKAGYKAEDNIIVGNVALYGATSGTAFINGVAGERLADRNSGAVAEVEGVGEHGCEYMTGGRVVVLGKTGKNFAAGMSGGIAYVLDVDNVLYKNLNKAMISIEKVDNKYDKKELRDLIEAHVEATGSEIGKKVLADFDSYLPHFKKLIPDEYKRMITLSAKLEEKGLTSQQAQMEAFYESIGVKH